MPVEIQWRCKNYHPGCQGVDWKHYKNYTETDAEDFMETKAPNSRHFEYRIKPEKEKQNEL